MQKILLLLLVCFLTISFDSYTQTHFGNGSDGSLTIASGDTYFVDDIRAAITGDHNAGAMSIEVSDGTTFSPGDEVLIITMQDSEADSALNRVGIYETNHILSILGNTLNLNNAIGNDYISSGSIKHQVIKVLNFTDVTITGELTCNNWDSYTGGVLYFRASGTVTINASGSINTNGKGYRGGTQLGYSHGGGQGGESFIGLGGLGGLYTSDPHGKIGGGGAAYNGYNAGAGLAGGAGGSTSGVIALGDSTLGGAGGGGAGHAGSGGGAGYGTYGYGGSSYSNSNNGLNGGEYFSGNGGNNGTGGGGGGGGTYGDSTLTRLYLGCGGGRGGRHSGYSSGAGGNGGGILYIAALSINNVGNISSNANNAGSYSGYYSGGGGGGAGGSVYMNSHNFTSSLNVLSNEGSGSNGYYGSTFGGDGGKGRTRINSQNYTNTGITSPLAYEENLFGILHSNYISTSDITGPYVIEANIIDEQGNTITSATVHYRVNNGSWSTLSMTNTSGILYSGNIPGQSGTSDIDYYITATDGIDNYTIPETAPTVFFSFSIEGQSPSHFILVDDNAGNIISSWDEPVNTASLVGYNVYRSDNANFTPGPTNLLNTVASDTFYIDNTVNDFYSYYYIVGANYGFEINYTEELSVLVNDFNFTTVLGYAFLEGQSNHANIKIKFNPVSPSAVLDSTYTDALGYFETTVVPGIYTVTYEKVNYQTYTIEENFSIIDDHDFGESTILYLGNTNISGNVSGIWNGIYTITGDITVPNGDSLIIEAGSEIRFLGNYHVYVYGYLSVEGVEGDSVLFTSAPYNQIFASGQWKGIDFYNNADDNGSINYAIIQYVVDAVYMDEASITLSNSVFHHCSSNGIQLNGSTALPNITNVDISYAYDGIYNYYGRPILNAVSSHNNSRYGLYYEYYAHGTITNSSFNSNSSHGIYLYNRSSPTIDSCLVSNNNTTGFYFAYYSSPLVKNSTFSGNSSHGIQMNNSSGWINTKIQNCIIEDNGSQGIYCYYYLTDVSEISDCIIRNNGNSGIYMNYHIRSKIFNNEIYGNGGHGIYFYRPECYPQIHHNKIAYNGADGIHKVNYNGTINIYYNTIFGNAGDGIEVNNTVHNKSIRDNIITNNQGYGLRNNVAIHTFEYNDVYSNGLGEISNTGNLPVNGWDFVSFNAINDSADIYLNISEDPLFVLNDTLDFYLQDNSPCINTGDPGTLDPDNTDSDIGHVYHNTGVPPQVFVTGFGDQTVSIGWYEVEIDSLLSYNVYYKLNSGSTYTLFGNTTSLSSTVTGLTNNALYDFTITGVFANYVSDYAPPVSERPGVVQIDITPESFNVLVNADTITQNLSVTNNGSRELFFDIPDGVEDGAMHCDGSYDYIYTSDHAHLEGMTSFTIETRLRRTGNGHFEFVSKNYRQYSMYISSSNYFGMYKGYNGSHTLYQSIGSGYILPINEWHHLAVTWEGNDMWFYVDGVEVKHYTYAAEDAIPTNFTYPFTIGRRANESQFLNGDICEVRIWDYVRSPEEIRRYMNSSVEGTESGLLGYWPLHTDYADHSNYGVSYSTSGNIYLGSQVSSDVDDIPYLLPDGQSYTIAPSSTVVIPFDFWNTGQTGTYLYTQPMHTNFAVDSVIDYEMALTYGTTVPATPVHFSAVPTTGLPYTIVITDAQVDGSTIDVGDEIGVFDGSLCVGAGIFDGSFNFVITAWKADPGNSLDGYTEGNSMTFVIYDTSADLDAPSDATYIVGDGTFGFNEFSALSLNGTVYIIQEVIVTGGSYNLISFNLLPRYSPAETTFNDLQDLQIAYNDAGAALIPPYSINTIGDIYFLDGYHVFSSTSDTIFYEGTSINPLNWGIQVEANKWNSISFLGESALAVTSAFDPIIVDSISIVQTSDGSAWVPGLINTIGNLTPGIGYQIALSSPSDIEVLYQTNNGNSKEYIPETPATDYFSFEKTGIPYQIIIESPSIEGLSLNPGDEIAVFDGDRCVGASVYTGDIRTLLTAWQKDNQTKLNGFEPGHEMQFRIYSAQSGELIANSSDLNSNNNKHFLASDYAYISLEGVFEGENNLSCYPNPFSDETNISIVLNDKSNVYLRIVDISGKVIRVLVNNKLESGIYNYKWTGSNSNGLLVPTGIYFIELNTDDYSSTEKLIRIR